MDVRQPFFVPLFFSCEKSIFASLNNQIILNQEYFIANGYIVQALIKQTPEYYFIHGGIIRNKAHMNLLAGRGFLFERNALVLRSLVFHLELKSNV